MVGKVKKVSNEGVRGVGRDRRIEKERGFGERLKTIPSLVDSKLEQKLVSPDNNKNNKS